jgi:hypothetical protein
MARKGALTPKPMAPKDSHKADGSYRVKCWGGPAHGWWIRVFTLLPDWDADLKFPMPSGEETYRLHIWPDDGGVTRASYLHSSTPTPKESASS